MRTRHPSILIALAASFAAGHVARGGDGRPRAISDDGLWTALEALPDDVAAAPAWVRPLRYTPVALQLEAMGAALREAPREFTPGAATRPVVISLPLADGTFARFAAVDSPVMEPELAAKFPEIRTFSARGIDDPTATARLDLTPAGFHAQILSDKGRFYIDPVSRGDTTYYAAYERNDLAPRAGMGCTVLDGPEAMAQRLRHPAGSAPAMLNFGTQLSRYRIAVAATGEYTTFHGGTVAAGLAAITTSVNRVSGIYERDLAVRLVLVANNNLIVYTNAATDPYTNTATSAQINTNHTNITSVIGTANFDVGHLFGTDANGGIAQLSCVCSSTSKGRGTSMQSSPVGDGYDVDYVAHELGHQFGGNHTFNACATAGPLPVEPGSGITIMAYAGICGANNDLAPHSIPNFHISNILNEMRPFITGSGNACATPIATGNGIPFVEAGANYTIPSRTPYMLTAAGSDPDSDPITYQWELTNSSATAVTGASGIFPDTGVNPILVSDPDTSSPVRIIPALANLLSNTVRKGETLPTTNRTLNFRATVRDGRGGLFSDTMSVTSVAAAGPFVVTSPNTAVSWQAGLAQTVTWNVAGTTAAPINAANVDIALSLDGGVTWPVTLASGVPNSGSASVVLPNSPTSTARIRVMGSGNIFFDISNTNFTITPAVAPPCYANCDGSTDVPVLSANDFSCFLGKFRAGDPGANCDGSTDVPTLSANDFSCFLAAFRAGCP